MLYNKDLYIAPVNNVIGRDIKEWDISKANISILRYLGILSKSDYEYLYNADKLFRQIQVGMMQKDSKIANSLSGGFRMARKLFFDSNGIQDYEVLSIKKDAIYLIDKIPSNTSFYSDTGCIEFVSKNEYTSYYRLAKIEYYFKYSNQEERIDVKGISDNMVEVHRPFMIDFLSYIFIMMQKNMVLDAIKILKDFMNEYLYLKLNSGFYRELNNRSMYRTKYEFNDIPTYLEEVYMVDDKIDISFNYGVLNELFQILSGYALMRKR